MGSGEALPRSLGLGKARFWPADSVSECCVCTPSKFSGLAAKFSGLSQNSPESVKILRTPSKPRDWLALAAADVLIQGGIQGGILGVEGGIVLLQFYNRFVAFGVWK